MRKTRAFAILAPVPEIHLISGLDAIAQQLDSDLISPEHPPKVAFGSMDFEIFGKAETLRDRQAVEVLIYASHAQGDQPLNSVATWRGLYIGSVQSRRGRYPGNPIFRPKTTASDSPDWAIFWEVQDLERLKTPIPIGRLKGMGKKSTLQPRLIPEGPILIEHP